MFRLKFSFCGLFVCLLLSLVAVPRIAYATDCGEDYKDVMPLVEGGQYIEAERWLQKRMDKCEKQSVYQLLMARVKQKMQASSRDVYDMYQQAWVTYKTNMDVEQYVTIPDILGPIAMMDLQEGRYHIALDRFKTLEKFREGFNNFDYYHALAYKGAELPELAQKSFEKCLQEPSNRAKAPICFQYLYPAKVTYGEMEYQQALRDIEMTEAAQDYYQNIFQPRFQKKYPYHLQKCISEIGGGAAPYQVKAVISLRKMGGVEKVQFEKQDKISECLGKVMQYDVFSILPHQVSIFRTIVDIQLDG